MDLFTDRQVGLVTVPPSMDHAGQYRRTVIRIAVRCRQANGQWGVLFSMLVIITY